jgi:hypothetical protein
MMSGDVPPFEGPESGFMIMLKVVLGEEVMPWLDLPFFCFCFCFLIGLKDWVCLFLLVCDMKGWCCQECRNRHRDMTLILIQSTILTF